MEETFSDSDGQLVRMIVEKGLATPKQIEACLRWKAELAARGVHPLPRLGEMLAQRGYITSQQLHDTMRLTEPAVARRPAKEPTPMEIDGERVGKYVKQQRLGVGGMGEVWKAWDSELRRWVALKFLKHENVEERERFKREAQLAAHLSHPNITSIYEANEHYIAMQLVEGETLAAFPRGDVRLLVRLIRDVARAVHHAHERAVIHRDLKPGNIMVEGDRVFIMDFGLAKSVAMDSALSVTGTVMGTPSYMSPEQARGAKLDHRTDIYSLGATLYELLTDRPPHVHPNPYELMKRIVEEDPLPLRRLKSSVDPDLETIVLKCLENDPERRYPTSIELAEDLRRWLDGEAIEAHAPSTIYRTRKYLGKHKAVLGVAAAGVIALLGVGGFLASRWLRERGERRKAEERQKLEMARVQELGMLWAQIILAKQGYYSPAGDPKKVRARVVEAIDHVSGFIQRNPELPQGYFIRARGRLYLEDLDGAEEDLRRSIGLNEKFFPAADLLAGVLIVRSSGDVEQKLYRVRATNPYVSEAISWLQRSREGRERGGIEIWGMMRTREDEVSEVLAEAYELTLLDNNPDAAMELLRRRNGEESSEEYCYLLSLLVSTPDDMILWSNRAVEQRPHFAKPFFVRGTAYMIKGDWTRALEDHNKGVLLAPECVDGLASRGAIRAMMGDPRGALEDFDRALKNDPRSARAYHNRGFLHSTQGEFEKAIQDLDVALQIDPSFATAWFSRGGAKSKSGDTDGGLSDFTEAIRLNPDLINVYLNRAFLYEQRGETSKSMADLDEAIRRAPRYAEAYFWRGKLHVKLKKCEEAVQDLTAAIHHKSDLFDAYLQRGLVYEGHAKCRPQEAVQLLRLAQNDVERVLRMAPSSWNNRTVAQELHDRVTKALRE